MSIDPKFLEALDGISLYEKKSDGPFRREYYHAVNGKFTPEGTLIKNCSGRKKKKSLSLNELYLYHKWCSGGITGGSCYGNESHYSITGEPEPDFEDFENILIKICPNIGYLQYKKLSKLLESDSYTDYEYYGNSTCYSYKTVLLKNLYDALKEMNIL